MPIKRTLFRDILRDKNSKKYSMTKVAALVTIFLIFLATSVALWIMIDSKEIDYVLIGELIALLLTLLGYKNVKGGIKLKKKKSPQYDTSDDLVEDESDNLD